MYANKLKGNLLLLLTALVWGVSFVFQSKGVEVMPPIAFNGIRSMLGGLVLLPVIFFLDKGKKARGEETKITKTLLIGGLSCGLCLFLATTLQTFGMLETSPGTAGFITALYMVIVPIIGIFMGKKPRFIILVSVLIALSGLYLMCISDGLHISSGDFLIFICAFVFATHIILIDHFSPKVDGVKLAAMQFFVCGIVSLIIMPFVGTPSWSTIWSCSIELAYSGFMSCGVAYTLQIVGQKYTDPTSASILMSLESVFATLSTVVLVSLGFNLTGGALSMREISGCALMFVAILLVQLPEKKR